MSDPIKKITIAEMRAAGVRSVLVYCSDYRCSHSMSLDADRWADDVRLSDSAASSEPWPLGRWPRLMICRARAGSRQSRPRPRLGW
jgi:hypothetical protein